MTKKTIVFINMGKWYLFHKVAENLKNRGWTVDCITYGHQLRDHCEKLNLYSNVYDLSLEIEHKKSRFSDVKHFFKNISINEIIKSDRYFCSKRSLGNIEIESYFTQLVKAIDVKVSRPEVLGIFHEPSSAISLCCGEISRYYNKFSIYPQWGRTNLGMSISDGYDGCYTDITDSFYHVDHKNFTKIELTQIKELRDGVISGKLRLLPEFNITKKSIFDKIKNKLNNFISFTIESITNKYPIKRRKNFILSSYNKLQKIYRKHTNNGYFSNSVPNTKLIFFPLHYDPDLSSLLYARNNSNQIEVIRKLSLNIPDSYTLVIKEHPAMYLNRNKNFYKNILKNYNVILIDGLKTSKQLIENADAIITLSGTVGFESIFYGKRPIILADDYYNIPELFDRVTDTKELKKIIEDNIQNNKIEDIYIEKFAMAYLKNTTYVKQYSGTINYENSPVELVSPIADYVESQI
jgi:hypothetical protein